MKTTQILLQLQNAYYLESTGKITPKQRVKVVNEIMNTGKQLNLCKLT